MAASMASQSARLAVIAATISGSFIVDQARRSAQLAPRLDRSTRERLDSHSRGAKYCVG